MSILAEKIVLENYKEASQNFNTKYKNNIKNQGTKDKSNQIKSVTSLVSDPYVNLASLSAFENKKLIIYRTGDLDSKKNSYTSAI